MSAFEISVTPSRFKNKKNMESRKPTIVEMAPFSSKSIVEFEDVPVGKTAKRILRIINPSEQDIEVKVTRNINDLYNISAGWTENVVPAGNEVEMQLIWSPVAAIVCKETLQLTDNRNFRKDVMIIMKSKINQVVKNTRKFPTLSSGVQKATHTRTLRLKSPTSSNKLSKGSIQHRKSINETHRSSGLKTNPLNTKSAHSRISNKVLPKIIVTRTSPLTERNIYINEKPSAQQFQDRENSPFSQNSLKENVSPLTPGNVASLIDKLNFTPAMETISKDCKNKENISLWPTPLKHNYESSELEISNYLSEVRPRRLLSTELDDEDINSDCKKDNHSVPNKTFEIKRTDTFNISCNESLEISSSDIGRLSVGPVLNKTTTISNNQPMRALEMIQEEEGTNMNASTASNGGPFQKTYNLNDNSENSDLKRDIKLVGTPLRKYSESMKDLSLQSPKNKLGIQGSMPNLNEMETIRSIEQNRYFYQSNHKLTEQEKRTRKKENSNLSVRREYIDNHLEIRNSLDDSLNASTSSQASIISQAELMFNQNEILAQSSRFNINEIGLKSRKNSPSSLSATKNNNKRLYLSPKSTITCAEASGTKSVKVKKRRSLDLSQSDAMSNESISSIKTNKSKTIDNSQVSPPKRLRQDSNGTQFQRPLAWVNASENRQGNSSQTQTKKLKTVHSLSLLKKPILPPKEKLEKSMRLYDSDLYLQACINPDPFAATTTCDPFLASTMYLDAKAVERHQIDFKKWLNALVTIPADLDTDCNVKIDVGKLFNEVRNKDLILAPTKEEQSMNYLTQYRLEYLRRISIDLFMSEEMRIPCSKVAVYVNKNAIRIRSDRNLHLDVVMQRYILELLLCFNPLWLRLGLEVVYGERIHLHSNNDIVGLSTFILNRLFRDKCLEQKYSRAYTLSEQYADTIKKFTLTKFLFLLLFLDRAKTSRIVKHNPCLFNKKSPYKETKEILLKFSSELLANIGDITRELKRLGYILHHKQTYLDEFDYAFSNIAVDLRDGVRLTRVMEIILMRDDLTKQLRVPAISRLQRIFNVNLALKALLEADFHLKGEINAADIVDGHREKTLSLLWQIIYKFRSPKFHSAATCIQRWWRHSWLRVVIKRRIQHKEQVKRIKAATLIQSTYRGYITRTFFKVYKEEVNTSAKILQKYVKRYLARKRYIERKKAIVKIQQWYRSSLLTKQYRQEFLRIKACVIFVQRVFRRRLLADRLFEAVLKMRLQIQETRNSAAICIQIYWRSYKKGQAVRLKYIELKEKVIFLQRLYRAKLVGKEQRKRYLELRSAIVKIQTYYRSYNIMRKEREKFLRQKYLIIKVQRSRRATILMRDVRRQYIQDRSAIIKLQQRFKALMEMKKQRKAYESFKSNVVKIQRYYRARLEMKKQHAQFKILRCQVISIQRKRRATLLARQLRVEFINLQYHTIIIQQKYKARKEMRKVKADYEKLKKAAICLQSHYRALIYMRIERTKYLHLRSAVIVIQTRYRAYKKMRYDRARFRGIREATLCLQLHFRSYLQMKRDRKDFLCKKRAAIILQRTFRRHKLMKKVRMDYHNLRRAALIIQKYYRAKKLMQKQMKLYDFQKKLIIKIQQIYKAKYLGRQVRQEFLTLRKIVIVIQRRFKSKLLMHTERTKYEDTRLKIICLQKRFRAKLEMRRMRSMYLNKRKAIVSIQKWYRSILEMRNCQKEYQEKRAAIIFLQRKVKATIAFWIQRKVYLNTLSKITFLQNIWRATLLKRKQQLYYQNLKRAAIVVQNRYRSKLLMLNVRNQYLLIRSLIVSLQIKFRSYLLMKKQRAEFLELRQTTIFCQRKYRAKLVGLENRQRFLTLKQSLVNFQACARGFLARKRFQALMTPEMKELRLKVSSAVVIQRHWRGYYIRKRFHNIRLKLLRKNINDLKASSNVVNSIRNKVQDGVSLLSGRFNASEALQVLSRLDRISRTVPHLLMDHSNFISTFCYGIMAQTIRSEIDKQLIEHCSRIILNLARYNSTTANTFQESGLVTIAQMLLRWCDKDSEIFNTLCTLIWIFVQCPKKRKIIHDFMTTPEAIYMVRETKKLVARKEKMKQNVRNNAILSKNTKKLFSSRALPTLEPDYGVVQNHVYTFISSVFAFDTILCKLNISIV